MNTIFTNTHIVLDVPEPVATKVMNLRKKYQDHFRSSLPVEVTLTGSSGVGVLVEEQNPELVYETINEIASRWKPIETSLGEVIRFPNTDIFAFSITNELALYDLHRELITSEIKYMENPFPYKPHCTIRSLSPVAFEEEREITNNTITDTFLLDTISVYSLIINESGKVTLPLLHKVKLKG